MARRSSLRMSNFRRYPADGYIGGVCAGVATYLDWNVRLIRALAVLTFIFGGGFPILLVYALLWYVMEPDTGLAPPPYDHGDHDEWRPQSSRGRNDTPRRAPTSADVRARFERLEARLGSMEECVTSNDYELRRELRKIGA